MNTPNKLTVFRMVLTPFYLLVMLWDFPHHYLVAAALFSVGALTDFIDGKLARKYNQITVFGKLLDPIADKMLTTAALLAFLTLGWCDVWVVMIVLTREFVVTSVRLIASTQNVVIPANIWGIAKTVSQMLFSVVVMLLGEFHKEYDMFGRFESFPMAAVSKTLMWITAILALISGIIYVVKSKSKIDFSK